MPRSELQQESGEGEQKIYTRLSNRSQMEAKPRMTPRFLGWMIC